MNFWKQGFYEILKTKYLNMQNNKFKLIMEWLFK